MHQTPIRRLAGDQQHPPRECKCVPDAVHFIVVIFPKTQRLQAERERPDAQRLTAVETRVDSIGE
jgi:hypothetical protein